MAQQGHRGDNSARREPLVYRLQRMFLVGSVILGPLAILVAALANPPYYGSGPGEASAIATNAASTDLIDQTHLVAQLVAAYLLPIGLLVLAWLANQRAPWLATTGGLLTLIGFLPLALYVGQDSLYYDIARLGSNPQFVELTRKWNHDSVMSFYGVAFGLGTVLGPTLIGLGLWKSHTVPAWAALCMTLSRLPAFVFLAVPYRVAVAIVLIGVVLLVAGSLAAARMVAQALHTTKTDR